MDEAEALEFDVVIVGAGPAGLSAAIRLRQRAQETGENLSVCVLEKGSEVGAHILSGAVLETRALDELLPDWQQQGAPVTTQAQEDAFYYLTPEKAFKLPTPPPMRNDGNYIVSLGQFVRWLGNQAESLGADIYPGFAVGKFLQDASGTVIGVETVPMGIDQAGNKTPRYEPGVEVRARHVLFAEGCRGSLAQKLFEAYDLRKGVQPQTYGLGLKELWEIPPDQHRQGHVTHTIGWPLDHKTYGGSFLYHLENNQVAVGFVLGLDYQNPYLNPYEEFQRFKHHPLIRKVLEGGRRLAYGARALNEGGWQSIPKLSFPGGSLIGCAAGFLNVPKIKGTHTAMKSGMVAAEVLHRALSQGKDPEEGALDQAVRQSWIGAELKPVRNIRPAFKWGQVLGLGYAALETYVLRGKGPWTFSHRADHTSLDLATASQKIPYPKHDGVVSFDLMSSVYLSHTNHEEKQPAHLTLKNPSLPVQHNLPLYDAPEQRYCPAGVYEIVTEEGTLPRLHIHAQNCLHCKTCDIKDPSQNIVWVPPEGGGGPLYSTM